MKDGRLKLLYIAGSGRSGSTLLHNVLGQIDGFFGVGELHQIWGRSFESNLACGCTRPFRECPSWRAIVTEVFGDLAAAEADVPRMKRLATSFGFGDLPAMHLPSARKRVLERLRPYLETLERLYRAVAATSGARVIVDSSKSPAYGHLLGRIAGLDLRVLHLVRDPRATSHSWTRKKLFTPEGAAPVSMERRPPARSALQWNARNLLTEVYARPNAQGYLRLRYEDLVARPEPALRKVLELVGESADLGFVDGSSVEMRRRCHSVFGNLARFDEGTVALRPDERWKQEMRPLQKGVVTAMTLPLLLRYGYSLAG